MNSVAHIAEVSSGFCSKFNIYRSNLQHILRIVQDQLKSLAQASQHNIVVSWDNFDYNQTVRHQTLRDPAKHISATTGKLCISQYIPNGGLLSSMFYPEIPLTVNDVYLVAGNQLDDIKMQCQ
jgi:hypothetical protein